MTNAEQPLSILPLNRHEDCRWQRDDDQKVVDTVIARAEKAEAQLEAQVKELEYAKNVKFELRRQIEELEAQLKAARKEIVSNHKGLALLNKFYEEEIVKRANAEEKVKALEAQPESLTQLTTETIDQQIRREMREDLD